MNEPIGMETKDRQQTFALKAMTLSFDLDKAVLRCRPKSDPNKTLWIKKLAQADSIAGILEDNARFYIATQSGEQNGQFIAVDQKSGKTVWFIPGKSYLQVLYGSVLYLIFVDEKEQFYLIKVACKNGKTQWHYRIAGDLCEYRFGKKEIALTFASGARTVLAPGDGRVLGNQRIEGR